MADKNLGPVVMEQCTYIQSIIREYLLDPKGTYQRVEECHALSCMNAVHIRISKLVNDTLTGHDGKYFKRNLDGADVEDFRVSTMYGITKLHKNKFLCPFRPVISQCGSFLGIVLI